MSCERKASYAPIAWRAPQEDVVPPTTVYLVLLRSAIVASSRSRCALTRSGGVRASHCNVCTWPLERGNRGGKAATTTDLVQADVLEAVGVEDFEEVQRRVPSVLNVMPERGRDEANVAGLGAGRSAQCTARTSMERVCDTDLEVEGARV